MPKMYNPDTQETVEADGPDVQNRKALGFVTVGNRPEEEYVGKTRDELGGGDDEVEEPGDAGGAGEPVPPPEEPPTAEQLPA